MEWPHAILLSVAATWAAFWLLAPLLVWHRNRIPASYRLEAVPQDEVVAMEPAGVESMRQWLGRMGFEALVASRMPGQPSRVGFILFHQPDDPCGAVVVAAHSARRVFSYLEFTQRFVDGSVLCVNGNPLPGAYPSLAGRRVLRFPEMTPAELHAAFLRLRARVAHESMSMARFDARAPLVRLQGVFESESRMLARAGCLVEPPGPDGYRLTLSSAYAFSWRLMWPWVVLRDRWQRFAALRALDAA